MNGRRRLSESIAEGEGISVLVEVRDLADLPTVEASGAEGVVLPRGSEADVASHTALPVLVRGDSPEAVGPAGADGWVLVTEEHERQLAEQYAAVRQAGLECVVDVQDEEELERVLELVDAEIILLSARGAEGGEEAVDRVLELLPDVPAGMLVVAEVPTATEDDIMALERAGVDAVLLEVAALARLHAAAAQDGSSPPAAKA